MEEKKIKIGLIGLGTVGSGVYKTLEAFKNIEVVKIAVKNKNKKRNIPGLDENIVTDNAYEVVNDPEIEIVCELVGGVEPAFDLIKTALKNGSVSWVSYNTSRKALSYRAKRFTISSCLDSESRFIIL